MGVPQGSVLGPVLFSLYTSPIAHIAASHSVSQHQYADDTQLFISLSSATTIHDSVKNLEACLHSLYSWFCHNGLSLNANKSDLAIFGTSRRRQSYATLSSVDLAGTSVKLSDSINLLGVTFDDNLSFDSHVAAVCKSSWFHLRALKHIRHSIDIDTARSIGHALVSSRLDYANAILHGTSSKNILRLQRVQNSLARVVLGRHSPAVSSYSLLRELHWLPVKSRITFKLATLAYKCRYNTAPQYLSELVTEYKPSRTLRSANDGLLALPRVKTQFGARGFRCAAPRVWNSLNTEVRMTQSFISFRQKLKTDLFAIAFN